jgi:SET and MYND domain-containing protein 4
MIDRKKNSEKSDKFRDKGNLQFQSSQHLEALLSYNRSLCLAPPDSPQVSLAYANRSAVYLKVKLFHKCLQNIELARKFGYPADKLHKLDEREDRCQKLIESHKISQESDPRENFFKLSYPPHEKIPFVANCIEVKEDEKYGRYVVTNRNLEPGDIIAIDEPVYKFVDKEVFDRHCANCLKSNDLSLIPCVGCTYSECCFVVSRLVD